MKQTIVLADDEPIVVSLVQLTLGGDDRFAFYYAADGEEAVELCRQHHPDLVLMDIMMPNVDGIEACRIIKHDRALRRIPVVMLTAMTQEHDMHAAFDAGAEEYITKPFSPSELVDKIMETLAHPFGLDDHVVLADGRTGVITGRLMSGEWQNNKPGYKIRLDGGGAASVFGNDAAKLERAA